jgi:hypothetical protein
MERATLQSGHTIIMAMVFTAIMLTLSVGVISYTGLHAKAERQAVASSKAFRTAEAGMEKAMFELNSGNSYSGETNVTFGEGTFTVAVTSLDTNNKRITATGYIPNSISPVSTKTISATVSLDLSNVAFNFGVQVGAGGLNMANNSAINGNVFSNGPVSGTGLITGDTTVALGGNPIADQQWTTYNNELSFGNISSRRDVAQSFTPSASNRLNKVGLFIRKVGTPGDLTVRVVTDASDEPSKSVLASTTVSTSLVTSTLNFIDAAFSTPPTLNAGQKYWIIISPPSVNNSNYFAWGYDSADGYESETGNYSSNWNASSPVWNAVNGDFNFKAYMGGVVNTLTGVTVGGNARAESMANCTVAIDAYFQDNDGCAVGGSQHPFTDPPGPAALPVSEAQIENWKTAAADGGTIDGPYTVIGTVTMGPKKIDGDMDFENGATLILTGPLWVKGNLTISNNAIVRVSNDAGGSAISIVADNESNPSGSGLITVSNNVQLLTNNIPGSFIMLLSTKSSTAIDLDNNAAGAVFYANNGTIEVRNNAGASQLTGYGISLNNNASVTYTNGLASSTFTNGPGGSWRFVPGTYVISD